MDILSLLVIILFNLKSNMIECKTKYMNIKSLNNGKCLLVYDTDIYIWDYNNDNLNSLINFESINPTDNVIIIKHIFNNNIYIFCLIRDYLYIYIDGKTGISYFRISNFLDNKFLKYKYYNIIPYTNYDKIDFILSSLKEEIKEENCIFWVFCDENHYYYNSYLDYNIYLDNKNNLKYTKQNSRAFNVPSQLLNQKNMCYIIESSSIIKCIYYDNIDFFPLQYDINTGNFKKSERFNSYSNYKFNKIASTKSNKNFLVCPLFIEKNCYNNKCSNFTKCQLCDENNDYNKCFNIEYSYEEDCCDIEVYYFNETDKYVLICKTFNKFILSTIDHDLKKVTERKIIYLNCTDNSGYDVAFSLIYNTSNKHYNLITEYNITSNTKCFLYQEETNNETLTFKNEKNISDMETIDKEIIEDNSHFIRRSYRYFFSELTDSDKIFTEESNEEIYFSTFLEDKTEDTIFSEKYSTNEIRYNTTIPLEIKDSSYIEDTTNKIVNIKTDIKNEETIIIKETTNKTKEEIMNNIEEIMNGKEIGKNYEIKGDDYTIIIKPSNSTPLPNTTHVEFDECEKILRKENNISNTSIITFFQMEINNDDNNALYNQIKYATYDDQLKELDLSVCKNIETKINYAIKEDSNLDLSKISNYKNLGVDILNINDDFFTNLCYAFSSSNNDMILEDRIKYIFQNYSLCEEGCSYNSLNIEQRSISCDCKIQGNISRVTNPLVFDSGKEPSFLDSNIGVSKCYNLVFSLNNKSNNIGFIIFSILVIIYIIFILIQIKKGIKPVYDYLYKEMIKHGYLNEDDPKFFENKKLQENKIEINYGTKIIKFPGIINNNNSSHINKKKKVKIKIKRKIKKKVLAKSIQIKELNTSIYEKENKIKDNENNKNSKGFQSFEKIKLENTKKLLVENDSDEEDKNFGIIKINIKLNIKKYIPKDSNQSLLNYTFDEAIRYDKRNIFRILYIYLLSKQIIFRTFLQKSPLELYQLRFTLLIFMLSCDLALNALFYFNDNISKKYHNASNLFLFTFNNNITIIIYSTLISYFLLTLLSKLSNSTNSIRNIFRKEEAKIKKNKHYIYDDKTKKNIFHEVENVLKYFKIKIIILVIIETIMILFFWYFVTAFCHVYSSTQTSWLLDSFLSILSRFMCELIFAFLFAKLYLISVGSNIETFYKIILCIYNFS